VQSAANSEDCASVAIPSGATFAIIGISYYEAGDFTSNTITLDGQTATLIEWNTHSSNNEGIVMYYVSGFNTGSKSFAWDWNGTSTADEGAEFMLMFVDGVDTTSPLRDHKSVFRPSSPPAAITTPSITSSATDWMFGVASGYTTNVNMTASPQTERVTPGVYNGARYDCATKAGADSSATMTATCEQCGLIAASIKAAAGAAAAAAEPAQGKINHGIIKINHGIIKIK
jgi:hypothetical protein